MVENGAHISELGGVKFGHRDGTVSLTELQDGSPLVLVFLRHFG